MDAGHYVRHASRALRARPVLTLVCVSIIALGIGASTAVASAVHALLMRPLPLPHADRLVTGFALREGFDPFGTSLLEYEAFGASVAGGGVGTGAAADAGARVGADAGAGAGAGAFESIGLARRQPATLRVGADSVRIQAALITGSYLSTAGVTPALGRTIGPADDRPGAPAVVAIGHALWTRQLGARADAIGSTLLVDGRPATVVGVMPALFDLPNGAELWMPMQVVPDALTLEQRLQSAYTFLGRLRRDVSIERANMDVLTIARGLAEEYPAQRRGWTYRVLSLRQYLIGDVDGRTSSIITVIVGAVALLMALCYVNVTSLLLLYAADRQRAYAVRLALGASARQLTRERCMEYGMIGLAGGASGALLASWLAPLIASLNPVRASSFAPLLTDFRADPTMLAIATIAATLAAIAIGLVAGMGSGADAGAGAGAGWAARLGWRSRRGARADSQLSSILMASAPRAGVSRAAARRLRLLVAVQIAVAMLLLVGGGLVARSFDGLRRVDLGFQPDSLLSTQLTLPPARYTNHRRRAAAVDALVTAARSLPGVSAAGLTTNIPLQQMSFDSSFTVEGRPPAAPNDVPITAHRVVTPGYLQLLGVRLVRGRLLNDADTADAPRVVVITEELARQAWPGPGQDPIGRRIRRGRASDTSRPWLTVVGIVEDVKEDRFNFRIDRAGWYMPYAQEDNPAPVNLVMRSTLDSATLTRAIRERVRVFDPDIAVVDLMPMTAHTAEVLVSERFAAVLLTVLAAAGLLLAMLGLYGAVSHVVLSKRTEMALRLAVGAPRTHVVTMVVREVALVAVTGIAVGAIAAALASRTLGTILYGVAPHDGLTYACAAALVAIVSTFAAWAPAVRAANVDPASLLR